MLYAPISDEMLPQHAFHYDFEAIEVRRKYENESSSNSSSMDEEEDEEVIEKTAVAVGGATATSSSSVPDVAFNWKNIVPATVPVKNSRRIQTKNDGPSEKKRKIDNSVKAKSAAQTSADNDENKPVVEETITSGSGSDEEVGWKKYEIFPYILLS